ncbi:MAG: serine protein kinase RIO [DPANN group archaeon]|nr:serine protein kinase RIO [DPANN group archaeon]
MAEQKRADKDRKIRSYIYDKLTIDTLGKMIDKKCINEVMGIIKSGKESKIVLGKDLNGNTVIIKIYMIATSSFTNMMQYIQGDNRFVKIGKTKRKIVETWCQKEMRNLEKAHSVGLSVPKTRCVRNNVLIMDMIEDGGQIANQLSKTILEDPTVFFNEVKEMMRILFKDADLVHADLSQYNILVRDEKPVFIDMGQSVLKNHPQVKTFLKRDVKNIVKYFNSLGVETNETDLYEFIIAD